MPASYENYGVRFRFPDDWELTEETAESAVCITVSSSPRLFWSLTLFFDGLSPDEVVETALRAFQDEYPELDVYPSPATLGEHSCVAADIEFVTLDLVNSAFVRSCRTDDFTALVLYQGTDRDLDASLEVLEAISASLELDARTAEEWPDFAAREDDADVPADSSEEFPVDQ